MTFMTLAFQFFVLRRSAEVSGDCGVECIAMSMQFVKGAIYHDCGRGRKIREADSRDASCLRAEFWTLNEVLGKLRA